MRWLAICCAMIAPLCVDATNFLLGAVIKASSLYALGDEDNFIGHQKLSFQEHESKQTSYLVPRNFDEVVRATKDCLFVRDTDDGRYHLSEAQHETVARVYARYLLKQIAFTFYRITQSTEPTPCAFGIRFGNDFMVISGERSKQ